MNYSIKNQPVQQQDYIFKWQIQSVRIPKKTGATGATETCILGKHTALL